MSTTMKAVPKIIEAAKHSPYESAPTLIFDKVCADLGFNPTKYTIARAPFAVSPTKRDRHKAGKLTQRVWDSLLPDGSVDPTKAVPISAVNTQELPQIGGDEAV